MAGYAGETEGASGGWGVDVGAGGSGGTGPAAEEIRRQWKLADEVLADPEATDAERTAAKGLLSGRPDPGFLGSIGEAVRANIQASPGENPREFIAPGQEQATAEQTLATRAGAAARAEQAPSAPTTTAGASVSGKFGVPAIGANTRALRGAAGELGRLGGETAGALSAAGGRLQGALQQAGSAEEQAIAAEAERAQQASAMASEKVNLTQEYVQGIRDAEVERDRRLAARDAALKQARDVTRYHRLPPEDVAALVDRRENLRKDLAAGHPMTAQGVADFERKKLDLQGVEDQLAKASEMRGEWDFDQPEEIFAAIAMSIAQGLGAFGSAMTGAPNYAMQIAQARAKRIADRQKDEIARREKLEGDVINDFDRYMQVFGDERAAEQAIYLGELARVDAALESLSLGMSEGEARAKIEKARADNQAEQAKVEMDITQRTNKVQGDALAQSTAVLGDALKMEQSAAIANQQTMAVSQKVQQETARQLNDRYVHGLEFVDPTHLPTEKDRGKVQDWYPKYQDLQQARSELIKFRGDWTVFAPEVLSDTAAKAVAAWSNLINTAKDVKGMGANFTVMEKELLELRETGGPRELTQFIEKLQYNMEQDAIAAQNKLGVYGYRIPGSGGDLGLTEAR